ncbi:MAG: AMP-binding protein, partial [Acidobacteria bacterium]|nr:AMP-binding protein [Acidobacteriota bacterium]
MSSPTPTSSPGAVQARVLNLVDEFVSELRGGSDRRVRPDDDLEQDLGIGSLERVELAVRLEEAFDVRLGDELMVEAETPADLVTAVTTAGRVATPAAAPAAAAPATTAPEAAVTLIDAFEWHATRTPDRTHIHLREDDGAQTPITYGALWEAAVAVANGLAARRVGQRETVAIMLRTEQAFFPTFLGTLLAGCIPVPLYPPVRANRIEEYAARQVGILRNAGARLLITFAEIERLAGVLLPQVPSLEAVVTPDALSEAGGTAGIRYDRGARGGGESALIQYTSGSTGNPKGVLLSHANLLANIRAIEHGLGARPGDVGVSWLPLYHDMGLIGAWLGTMYMGIPLMLMSPLAFLARPIRWLRALSDHRGTLSPAPNFAYDLCSQRIRDDELEGIDLSSARRLLNGSEAVHPESLERFRKRFEPLGLRPEALCPVYGLAECSVALAVPPVERGPRIDAIDRAAYQEHGRAAPVAARAAARRVVG